MRTSRFSLVKWYMDCVSDSGEAAILYFAYLNWRGIRASIGSLLTAVHDEAPSTRTSLARFMMTENPEQITVEHARLSVRGCWQAGEAPFRTTVYEEERGSIVWNCRQPRSQVTLQFDGRELTGLGYAECLTVSMPPWHLPMEQLRWGRFVAPDRTLAWVDWQGPYSTRIGVLDSRACTLQRVSDSEVDVGDGTLAIAPGVSLRSGRVGSTILPGSSGLRRLFPRSMFNIDEQKSLNPGTLTLNGESSRGWVIHEVVKWEL